MLSGTCTLPSSAGWMLDIALSKGIHIDGGLIAELTYRLQYQPGLDRILSSTSRSGALLSIFFATDPTESADQTRVQRGALTGGTTYFLCCLTDEKLKDLHATLLPVIAQTILEEDGGDAIPVSFSALRKTYLFIEAMKEQDFLIHPRKFPVAENTFQQACQCLYAKSLKQLRYERTLQTALAALYASDKTIRVIQEQAGYVDGRSFQKAFKHAFGLTPETLRRH